MTKLLKSHWATLAVLLASVITAFSFGFSYGNVGNQQTYLPHALHHLNPDFLRHDWFVRDTTSYHPTFQWIVALAARLGPVEWTLAWFNLAAATAILLVVFRLCRTFSPGWAVHGFFLALLFLTLDRTQSVGASYLISNGLQPSMIATLGWMFSILFFLRGNAALSGIALGLAGLFHANFLILGVGLFGMAQLVLKREKLSSRLAWQVVPSLIALIPTLPLIVDSAGGASAALAREIFQQVRSPEHYVPKTYLPDFVACAGWLVAGLGATCSVHDANLRASIRALLGSIACSVAGATILTTIIFVPAVAQLYVWRLAPFGVMLSQVLVSCFLAQYARGKLATAPAYPRGAAIAIAAGGLLVLRWRLSVSPVLSLPVLASVGVVVLYLLPRVDATRRWLSPANATVAATCAAILATVAYLPSQLSLVYEKSTLLQHRQSQLYTWARSTPTQTVFLIPPELNEFRIFSERAVVVDWKSTPIRPAELIVWRDRVQTVSGRPLQSGQDAFQGFRSRSLAELSEAANRFGARYIIVDRAHHLGALGESRPVFVAGDYAVFEASRADRSARQD